MPWYQGSFRYHGAGFVLVVQGVHFRDDSGQSADGKVVSVLEGGINRRIPRKTARCGATRGGIQVLIGASNSGTGEPRRVAACREIVGRIRKPIVVDDAPVAAELDRVFSFRPGDIVLQVVDRNVHVSRTSIVGSIKRREAAQSHEVLMVSAGIPESLSHEAVSRIVDQIRRENRCVPQRNALTVTGLDDIRGRSG